MFFTVFTIHMQVFVACKNHFFDFYWVWKFMLSLNHFLLLCFCFKNLDLLDQQTTQFDFSLSTLFVNFTSCGLKLSMWSLHPKQYVVRGFFSSFYRFYFWSRVFHSLQSGSTFLTIHLKHFDFVESFDFDFYSNLVFRKVSTKSFFSIQYWVWIISPSNSSCNALIISCSSQAVL